MERQQNKENQFILINGTTSHPYLHMFIVILLFSNHVNCVFGIEFFLIVFEYVKSWL